MKYIVLPDDLWAYVKGLVCLDDDPEMSKERTQVLDRLEHCSYDEFVKLRSDCGSLKVEVIA